jgi:NADH dehydrogenase/NADH:ubiquinone oxidoreductase subunit G
MPTPTITLTIDDRTVEAPADATVLEAAQAAGIDIPTLCHHSHLTPPAVCRLCVVEWEGRRTLQPACVTPVQQDAVIHTRSPRVETARRTLLEMLATAVDLSDAPELQAMMRDYDARPERFGDDLARREHEVIIDNSFFIRDYDKCVLCWRCVEACGVDMEHAFALGFSGRGFETSIATFFERPMPETTCVFCGNCVGVCPTGALKDRRVYELELALLAEESAR